jgi:hypothetical protein
MSHGKEVITKMKQKYSEQKAKQEALVNFAQEAVRFWYRANERVKKIHKKTLFDIVFQQTTDVFLGRTSVIQWLSISPIKKLRKIAVWILKRMGQKTINDIRYENICTYLHEFNKWQIEAIMGGQVKLSPAQIAVVIGIKEDEVRSMVQELAKEIEEFEKKSSDELIAREKARSNQHSLDRTVNTQK